ncbi:MAG: TVP38/TMEM64 family protein [Rhodospirillales bacterium]|nr:TVP38/TMEM64 family protein [Rhodospirillales bacterium]MSP80110.1 TVP38/TMEM64 family protein [Rhodospirillales bacterium]
MTDRAPPETPPPGFSPARLIPLFILLAGLAAFFAFGLHRHVSLHALGEHFIALKSWVAAQGSLALAGFGLVYALAIALSIPGGLVLTLTGAMLFGAYANTAVVVAAATTGATAVFLAARFGLGEPLRAKAGPTLKKMEAGFRRDAFTYLLALRLVPLFPFWLVNLAPAFLGVRLSTYVVATAIGIAPATFVFSIVGEGLAGVVEAGGDVRADQILSPLMIAALIALAALALVPVLLRRWREGRG